MRRKPIPTDAQRDARQRRIRTRFQTFVAACPVLLVAVPVIHGELDGKVPAHVYAVLASAALVITTGAGIVARVMALPAVAQLIAARVPWLSATPRSGTD